MARGNAVAICDCAGIKQGACRCGGELPWWTRQIGKIAFFLGKRLGKPRCADQTKGLVVDAQRTDFGPELGQSSKSETRDRVSSSTLANN
jgi:hypothetical protein